MPRAQDSRDFEDPVPVMSSTSFAVSRVSMSPTNATLSAVGAMICRVSMLSGTCITVIPGGRPLAISPPWSPTSGTSRPASIVIAVTSTIAISGAGEGPRDAGGQTDHDHEGEGEQRIDHGGHVEHVLQLRGEDQDAQGVDEPDHHRARDEPHDACEAQHPPEEDLDETGEDHRRQQVLDAVLGDQGVRRRGRRLPRRR